MESSVINYNITSYLRKHAGIFLLIIGLDIVGYFIAFQQTNLTYTHYGVEKTVSREVAAFAFLGVSLIILLAEVRQIHRMGRDKRALTIGKKGITIHGHYRGTIPRSDIQQIGLLKKEKFSYLAVYFVSDFNYSNHCNPLTAIRRSEIKKRFTSADFQSLLVFDTDKHEIIKLIRNYSSQVRVIE